MASTDHTETWGRRWRAFGPGLLVTAAFVGPGTVTTASKAGAAYGYELLWALLFAIAATMVLQEMSARLGLVARMGLGEAVRVSIRNRPLRWLACGLIILAIGVGNAAYQTGNLTGVRLGVESLTGVDLTWRLTASPSVGEGAGPGWMINGWPLLFGGLACGILWWGAYRWIERVLIAMVLVMSGAFVVTAVLVQPDWSAMAWGAVTPRVPANGWITAMALIATTIVPYNLFLHASAVQEKWGSDVPLAESLIAARRDSTIAIAVGGLITMAIMITAASALFGSGIELNVAEMARQLEPGLGTTAARWLFFLGLAAAGLTSAITAPLAAAYAVGGVLGWRRDLRSAQFRWVWGAVLVIGTILATLVMQSPMQVILLAQVAGGILLPLIAGFLLMAVNQSKLMGRHGNRWLGNLLGILVTLVAAALGVVAIYRAVQAA